MERIPLLHAGPAPVAPRSQKAPGTESFAEVFGRLSKHLAEGEQLLDRATRANSSVDATQLLALQVGIYRYSEALDLASKLVERTTTAVKTVVQSQ